MNNRLLVLSLLFLCISPSLQDVNTAQTIGDSATKIIPSVTDQTGAEKLPLSPEMDPNAVSVAARALLRVVTNSISATAPNNQLEAVQELLGVEGDTTWIIILLRILLLVMVVGSGALIYRGLSLLAGVDDNGHPTGYKPGLDVCRKHHPLPYLHEMSCVLGFLILLCPVAFLVDNVIVAGVIVGLALINLATVVYLTYLPGERFKKCTEDIDIKRGMGLQILREVTSGVKIRKEGLEEINAIMKEFTPEERKCLYAYFNNIKSTLEKDIISTTASHGKKRTSRREQSSSDQSSVSE